MKLTIGYFYPKLLNLYGDNGNVEILAYRAKKRAIDVEVKEIILSTKLTKSTMSSIDLVFMGGGPDAKQKELLKDLLKVKGGYLQDYLEADGVGLFICGAYQLLGHYYKASDGTELQGLGFFDLYTQHFGKDKPRCIGNVVCTVDAAVSTDFQFNPGDFGNKLVGFENHGGRTYLGDNVSPLAGVNTGFGNNSEDGTEGAVYKNSIGTYLHGPLLSKNPHFADFLISKALNLDTLEPLDDDLILRSHTAAQKLKQ